MSDELEQGDGKPEAVGVEDLGELTSAQVRALQALLHGQTVREAAEAAGVTRQTVHRWKREDTGFQKALNRLRLRTQERVQDRLMRAAEFAAETVASAAEGGDVQAATKLLKGMGMLDGTPPDAELPFATQLSEKMDEMELERPSAERRNGRGS